MTRVVPPLAATAAVALLLSSAPLARPARQAASDTTRDFEALPFGPPGYVCYRAAAPPVVDGKLDDDAWRTAPWTADFVNIEGHADPPPRFRTRARMLWDNTFFYVAAEMEEPDVWGTLTARDAIIYNDNDFEVFIDPDGDTANYYELEVNPLGTVFDLMLVRTYRDGGPYIAAWDITGLKLGVDVRGTLNRPGDKDQGWSVEMALPWAVLREAAPGRRSPQPGDQWRVNFSRVEWPFEVDGGQYRRRIDPKTGRPVRSDDWTWAPQGVKDIHMPERWGYVQFSGATAPPAQVAFVEDPNERVKWALRRLYYRQRRFRAERGRFATDLAMLDAAAIKVPGLDFAPSMQATASLFEISAKGFGGATCHIRQDGRVTLTR
jgi:hypothetical protein